MWRPLFLTAWLARLPRMAVRLRDPVPVVWFDRLGRRRDARHLTVLAARLCAEAPARRCARAIPAEGEAKTAGTTTGWRAAVFWQTA